MMGVLMPLPMRFDADVPRSSWALTALMSCETRRFTRWFTAHMEEGPKAVQFTKAPLGTVPYWFHMAFHHGRIPY